MDIILDICDEYFFTPYVYPDSWPADNIWRQFLTLSIIVNINGALIYFVTASISYLFVFDKRLLKHPHFLENQVQKEIFCASKSIPMMATLTCIPFALEVRGYSKLYDRVDDSKYGWWTIAGTLVTFLLFTDCSIYWIHRWLHHRAIYKYIHKDHHKWKVPTPYASHAIHPIDGFLHGISYHIYIFCFPMHKFTYLIMFIIINMWGVIIHGDGDLRVPDVLRPYVNGSAHHLDHHLFHNYNYGQYLTLWDRIGGSFRNPSSYEGQGPLEMSLKNSCPKQDDVKSDKKD